MRLPSLLLAVLGGCDGNDRARGSDEATPTTAETTALDADTDVVYYYLGDTSDTGTPPTESDLPSLGPLAELADRTWDFRGGPHAAGDVDADGLADVALFLSAHRSQTSEPELLLYPSSNGDPQDDVRTQDDAAATLTLHNNADLQVAFEADADIDSDGFPDVIAGTGTEAFALASWDYVHPPSAVYLFDGPWRSDLSTIDLSSDKILTGRHGAMLGGLSVGDLDGDGASDLAVSEAAFVYATYDYSGCGGTRDPCAPGRLYLFHGPITWGRDLADADAVIEQDNGWSQVGSSSAMIGDGDGDGLTDVVLGDGAGSFGSPAAGAWLFRGGRRSGWATTSSADATVYTESGLTVDEAGDLDGDGLSDFLCWDMYGVVFAMPADVVGIVDPHVNAVATVSQGASAAGDVDGDASADLLVRGMDGDSSFGGIYLGPLSGFLEPDQLAVRWEGRDGDRTMAISRAGVGDTNGDGRDDVVIGSWMEEDVYLLSLPGGSVHP